MIDALAFLQEVWSAKPKAAHLYFHSPCFDGAVSAAITSEYLIHVKHYPHVQLQGVNYDLRDAWLTSELKQPAAVVDFLYHPQAEVWADHHRTAFVNPESRFEYEHRRSADVFYDNSTSSCAVLLWNHWRAKLPHLGERFEETVRWADRIDSACYESVDQALAFNAPALQISLALAMYSGDGFSQHLVWLFRTQSLEQIAARAEVHSAFTFGRQLQELGQERLEHAIRLTENGIAVFDVNAQDVLVNRYAPFHFFPQARYSAGIIRRPNQAKLTVMRNPWLEFPSAPLGDICAELGGGGHRRVGSIIIRDGNPRELLDRVVTEIRIREAQNIRPAVAIA
jgi:hypothetical protein